MKPKILIVDEERAGGEAAAALEAAGCRAQTVATGEKAVGLLASFKPDVLITEIELPGISGFALLDVVGGEKAAEGTRTMVVTSDPGRDIVARAFEKGAEDFLVKPFDIRELVARVEVLLRRMRREPVSEHIRWGTLSLDANSRRAFVGKQAVRLTKVEFGVLLLLVQKAGRILPRDYLLRYLWGGAAQGRTRTVDMHVANIRRKLGKLGRSIETIKGVGYLLPRA
ncbi:MAG: response regulator transcription factor [Elusimicrobiota bacterium]